MKSVSCEPSGTRAASIARANSQAPTGVRIFATQRALVGDVQQLAADAGEQRRLAERHEKQLVCVMKRRADCDACEVSCPHHAEIELTKGLPHPVPSYSSWTGFGGLG